MFLLDQLLISYMSINLEKFSIKKGKFLGQIIYSFHFKIICIVNLGLKGGGLRSLLNPPLHTCHLTSDFIYIKLQSKWDRNVTCIKKAAASYVY